MQHWLEGHLCVWKTVSTRGGHYIRALHGEGGIKGEGAGPNHSVERGPTLAMIEKELEVLYQLGEPIIPFWNLSLLKSGPPTAPAKVVEPPGTQTTQLRALPDRSSSHSCTNFQCAGRTEKRIPILSEA